MRGGGGGTAACVGRSGAGVRPMAAATAGGGGWGGHVLEGHPPAGLDWVDEVGGMRRGGGQRV